MSWQAENPASGPEAFAALSVALGVPRTAMVVSRGRGVTATGDSITDPGQAARSYYNRLRYKTPIPFIDRGNFGIAGQRMDTILLRAPTDVLVSGAQKCFVNGGVNDIEQGRAESLLRADVVSYWNACLAAGIEPLDWNLPPRNVELSGRANLRIVHNLWRMIRARQLGIVHQDVWSRLAGADGLFKFGLAFDDLHPSRAGAAVIADANLEMLNPAFKTAQLLAPTDARISDGVNTLTYGSNAVSMIDDDADGRANNFGAIGAGHTYSITPEGTRPQDRGKWQRATLTGQTGSGFQTFGVSMATLGWTIGDKIALGFNFRGKAEAGQSVSLSLQFGSMSLNPITLGLTGFVFGETEEEFTLYSEATIASGTTFQMLFSATGTGYFEINRPVAVNLTKLGLA